MELIIFIAIVVVAALLWVGHMKSTQSQAESKIDAWKPPSTEQPWPYGEKVGKGKIHVKPADVAPGKSADDRVEAPAPAVAEVTAENKAAAVAKVKKAPAKKTAAKPAVAKKPAAAKKAPAKKKST